MNEEKMLAESFEQLLEESFKTLNTGDRVTGVVTGISPTDVSVDLGAKQAAYIPIAEFEEDPEQPKPGDEIECIVVRVNDVDGLVTLSKKRLEMFKNWDNIEAALDTKVPIEGTVVEENKGGVVVSCKGNRVFVPASQTGLPKDAEMKELMHKKVKLFITDINTRRRRVVGSIRSAEYEERKLARERVWNDIEVGKTFTGTVRSIMPYGVFVDIGGADGMVHITELTWSRVGHPSEIVKEGDKIEVRVINLDTEKKKISLSAKDPNENPWEKFIAEFSVGQIANVKIAKLMPFGAFAEIIPGVDGLIHISQISNQKIAKPGNVLNEGEMVDAKITDIDMEKKKVSLSIRALIDGESVSEEEIENAAMEDVVVASTEEPVEEVADVLEETEAE